jgi:PBP1b-binding outer membrane lipoprotein LpoB
MKKIAIIASIIASAFVLTSCASQAPSNQSAAASSQSSVATAHHHDYKGESATK